MLIELLRQHDIAVPPDAEDLVRLTPFGVALRYDDSAGEDEPTLERAWSMKVVQRILDWASA